jgi:hypothetical protein
MWAGLIARMSQYLGDGGMVFLNGTLYNDPPRRATPRAQQHR